MKNNIVDDFIDEVENHLRTKNSDGYPWTLIKILSYEGKVDELLDFVKKLSIHEQYYEDHCRDEIIHQYSGYFIDFKSSLKYLK